MKLRQVTRHRTVSKVLDGEEITYDEPYTEYRPSAPFNLDAALRKGLFATAVLMTIGAIIWGTVAIGGLLTILAPAWAAYLVASVFDAAWAACLVAEYLARHDEEKARLPRNAGIAALALSMSAIIWHGHLESAIFIGIIGAAVSLVSKGVWLISMQTTRVRLDKEYQVLLRQRMQKAGLGAALAQSKRDQILQESKTAQLLSSLGFGQEKVTVTQEDAREDAGDAEPAHQVASPDASQVSVPHLVPVGSTKTEKILSAASILPGDAQHADIAHLLAQHGCAVDTAYVRTVLSRNRKKTEKSSEGTGQYL